MTKLALDPASLQLYYPRASSAEPVKLRLIGQVCDYDLANAQLEVTRLANLPALHTEIDLDGVGPTAASSIRVNVSHILAQLLMEKISCGVIVSILGFYDGRGMVAVECSSVNSEILLGGSAQTLAEFATLRPL